MTAPRWFAVEYDDNSICWLVADERDRVCLVHGMQVEVTKLSIRRPLSDTPDAAATPAPARRASRKKRAT